MKSRKTFNNFVFVFTLLSAILFFCLYSLYINKYGPKTISYSQALQEIEKNLDTIDNVKLNLETNEARITIDGSVRYITIVPNIDTFSEKIINLKKQTENDFDVSIDELNNAKEFFYKEIFYIIILYIILNVFWSKFLKFIEKLVAKHNGNSEVDDDSDKKPKNSFFQGLKEALFEESGEEIKNHIAKDMNISFSDVAGMENVKDTLKDIATGIVNAEKYEQYGAKIPSGILLEGPSGTGKTLIAKALSGEIKVPFIHYSATEMSSKWVGNSEKRVREIFDYARENAPCIIFLDEIDSICRSRNANSASYEVSLLNQLLTCLDGFTQRDRVIFIAATNFAESLDEAITRPGRFDRKIHVDLPCLDEREAILKIHARNKKLSSEIDLRELAKNTAKLSSAHLANILNEAAIIQLKADREFIIPDDINEAHRNVLFGVSSNKKSSSDEKHLAAIHELGHAFTSSESIKEISIIPRAGMGGYTWYIHNDKFYTTANQIKEELVSLLGGRAAEAVILGDISTGAENDMKVAWQSAYNYITKYGMSNLMGPISITTDEMSDKTKELIFDETKKMINEAFSKATNIIKEKRNLIEEIAKVLENKETILGSEFYELL